MFGKDWNHQERTIFHVDVNSAFLSWEAVYRCRHLGSHVDLRQQTAAVGGDAALRHGIILASSLPAKAYGIRTGESILEARQKCPKLLLVPPDYGLYQKCSEAFYKILREYTPKVEVYSIDEAFMDMSGLGCRFSAPVEAADALKEQIRHELGFTVNVGISCNRLLAKMASDFEKPDRIHTLYPEEIPEKMWPLPVNDLFFAGRKAAARLKVLGIHTIGELAAADPEILRYHLKKHGEILWAFANGRDVSEVESVLPEQKGYGNSTTTPFDIKDLQTAKETLLALTETVGGRIRKAKVRVRVVSVGVKTYDFQYRSHQGTMYQATDLSREIYCHAVRLLEELWDGTPLRHLGIHTGGVETGEYFRQQELFQDMDYAKWAKAERAVDGIRRRYGNDSVKRAVFLNHPMDHMSGGISREKRTAVRSDGI